MVEEVPVPLNELYMPGRTDRARLAELGVRRISCGSLLYRTALRAAVAGALEIAGHPGDVLVPAYGDVQHLANGR